MNGQYVYCFSSGVLSVIHIQMAPGKKVPSSKSKSKSKPATVQLSIGKFLTSPERKDNDTASKHPRKRMRRQGEDAPGSPQPETESDEENTEKRKPKPSTSDGAAGNYEEIDAYPHSLGAHLSIAGGLQKALIETRQLRGSAVAFFLRPPRSFTVKPLADEIVAKWKKTAEELKFNLDNVVVHAPYLVNIGSPNGEALERSRATLYDDMQRCDKLGIKYYNVHPGSTLNQISAEKCCKNIAESANEALKRTESVTLLLENMAGQGNWVGSNFKELGLIISHVDNKTRIGVCLDTCHAFAYGYGINTAAGLKRLLDDFKKHIGMEYLKAVHVNDSKAACGDRLDRHEDIGKGVIGKAGFKLFMNEPIFRNIPLILETPTGIYDQEIKLLRSMVKAS